MQLFSSAHPVQIQQLLADDCVVVKNFVKFSEFEENDLLKVVLFDLPKLVHARCKRSPRLFRDE